MAHQRTARPRFDDPGGSSSEQRPAGFTFIELLVVLTVVGLMAMLLVPNLNVVRFRIDGAARATAAALVAAQRQAVKNQHDVIVAFDTARTRLRIHQDRDNDGVLDSGEPTRIVAYDDGVRFGLGSAPARPGYPGAVNFSESQDGMPAVRFTRSGSASEEGAVYLTSGQAAQGSGPARHARSVHVDRATGRVTWYEYDPPEWVETY